MSPVFRLIQADDLDAWQRVLLTLCLPAASVTRGVIEPPVVVVPNRAAADHWRETLEQRVLVERWTPPQSLQVALAHQVAGESIASLVMPRLVTRDELYDGWHRGARVPTPRLPALGREVLMGAAARDAARTHRPPFLLRPGLVAEMARFFDQVGRLDQDPLTWLEDAAGRLLEEAPTDRGAERLLQQTRFMQEAFRRFVARIDASDGLDERRLRDVLRRAREPWAAPHLIVTVGDHHADPAGLWPVDLRLIAQAPGLRRVDVVATRRTAEGLVARLQRVWPDAIEVRVPPQRPPTTCLEVAGPERRWIACRDRDEEVLAYVRRVKAAWSAEPSASALVFRRPLPYLYAAQHLLGAAGVPFRSSGTLPLAAEPWAAGLDLLMDVALSGFTRSAIVTLLRSPHVALHLADGALVTPQAIAALDSWLSRQRYLGTLAQWDALLAAPLPSLRDDLGGGRRVREAREAHSAHRVATAVRPVLARLVPLQAAAPGAVHVAALRDTWAVLAATPHDDDAEVSRTRRTRAAVVLVLEELAAALEAHDPAPVPGRDTCILVRRWIEERTFALPRQEHGVHLVDAEAARYGMFRHVRVVGVLEGEWPEPSARDIFYPAFMLERLGWAEERTRTGALRARFADLLTLPSEAVGVSVPELDQDAVVRPSSLLDELQTLGPDRQVPIAVEERVLPVTREDALLAVPAYPDAGVLGAEAREWAAWRLTRAPRDGIGQTAPGPDQRHGVTAVEMYLQCPFQYFAARVLGLQEEAEDEPGLPARDAGLLLHDVLHDGFAEWQRLGYTSIGPDDLPRAREVFAAVAECALAALTPADRAVERARLFGSAVSTGVLEKALRVEAEYFGAVTRRALEHDIDQAVDLPSAEGTRTVRLRGRVDRVDWTADGRVRVIDYKTGRKPTVALQPGVYAHAVVQQARARGEDVGIAPSGYIAFREEVPWIPAVKAAEDADDLARRFVAAVEQIEAGVFPVRPQNEFRCQFCDFASVCRKDYIGA